MTSIDDPGGYPPTTPHIVLGVPALLGTFTTPTGLDGSEFAPDGAALLNSANDGYVSPSSVTMTVVPEPMTLSLLAIGGAFVAIKRKRS